MVSNNSEIFNSLVSTFTDEQKMDLALKLASNGTKRSQKKGSINGAPVNLEGVTVALEEGYVSFKHPQFKAGRKNGYPLADLQTAEQLVEAQEFTSTNKITGTRFVSVEGKPYGENLVALARNAKILE